MLRFFARQQFAQSFQYTVRQLVHYLVDDILYGLSNEEIRLRKTVFDLAQKELAPEAHKIDKYDRFDGLRDFWKRLGHIGALGITTNPKYGGTGGTYLDNFIINEEISRACAAIGLSYGAHSILCVAQINRYGTETQKRRYLPKLCSGEHIGALAMSEAGAGSDVLSMKLQADKDEDSYILNGTKFWITNGPDADVLIVYAKTDPKSEKPQHGVSAFIVEKSFEGFSAGPKLDKMGMRGSNTSELIFENCRVPKENLLGSENKGAYVLMGGVDFERLVLSSGAVGLMQACCDVAFEYAHQRKHSNTDEFQMIQSKLAFMYATTAACRCYSYTVVRACDRNHINSKDCAAVALFVGEKLIEVALEATQILGINGYINGSPTSRFLRDSKLYEIGGGTTEIRKIVLARALNKEYVT
ncbi:hypothetical protein RI129_005439 [Pyrocoelia pectoralis]|uniref:Isovaleryl-CoA dehydrogenase n=1 Tax=Pyrocoelia pectoralis TaxID=417401 RepID=A0AAN7VE69_9COLE